MLYSVSLKILRKPDNRRTNEVVGTIYERYLKIISLRNRKRSSKNITQNLWGVLRFSVDSSTVCWISELKPLRNTAYERRRLYIYIILKNISDYDPSCVNVNVCVYVCAFLTFWKEKRKEQKGQEEEEVILLSIGFCPVVMTWSAGVSPLVHADLM